jgi:hypothetical protein
MMTQKSEENVKRRRRMKWRKSEDERRSGWLSI